MFHDSYVVLLLFERYATLHHVTINELFNFISPHEIILCVVTKEYNCEANKKS